MKFRVSCSSKPIGSFGATFLFNRPFKAVSSEQAIKLAKLYARKKGVDPKGCQFTAIEWATQSAPDVVLGTTEPLS